jgi:sugar phosphate isomerase/epimerase
MKKSFINRRHFMAAAGTGAVALGLSQPVKSAEGKEETCPDKGLKIGIASYSLRKFSLEEAIEITKKCGVKYITLKSFHLEYDTTKAEREAAAKKIADAGLVLMGAGVVNLKTDDEQKIKDAFIYCKDAGMPTMVTSPSYEALPIMEKYAKEYDIKVAIHNHGPGDKLYPSPMDAYELVKDMDPRMGCCIDIGHTVRIGVDEIGSIYAVKDRLHDFHIKDVSSRTPKGRTVPVGRGVINIPGILRALQDIGFNEHLALEYEADADAPLGGMRESFGYIRGALAAM